MPEGLPDVPVPLSHFMGCPVQTGFCAFAAEADIPPCGAGAFLRIFLSMDAGQEWGRDRP